MRRARLALLVLAGLVLPGARAEGQPSRAPVSLLVGVAAEGAGEQPRVVLGPVLESDEARELVRSGFPAQLRLRLELWRQSGWFYEMERAVAWDVVVAYDPAVQLYRVRRRSGSQVEDLGGFATLSSAQAALERPHAVSLAPSRKGRRYYYNLTLDVETLSVSDLDQLERWLRGELRPAVRGQNNPASALGTGVRTLVIRVLGGERRHYEVRSPRFRH